MNKSKDLPKWLWLWLPVAIALLPYIARIINPSTDDVIFGELGVIENITVIALLFALVAAIKSFIKLRDFHFPVFKFWIILLFLGCFYYAGEELSWGQHWIGWSTPEAWQTVNDQSETNLHNTSPFLDQIPRAILTLAAVIGGIIIPIVFILKKKTFSTQEFGYWLWPTSVCIPASVATIVVSLHEKVYKLFGATVPDILDIRTGETKEAMLAMFLFVYIASFYKRLSQYKGK